METRVDASDSDAALAQQLVLEAVVGNAQVRVADVLLGETGILVQLRDDVVVAVGRQHRALTERVEIFAQREVFYRHEQALQRRRRAERVMIPRRRGFGRQIEDECPIAAADRRAVVVIDVRVQERGEQDDAVERDASSCRYFASAHERVVPYDSPKRKRGEFQRLNLVM